MHNKFQHILLHRHYKNNLHLPSPCKHNHFMSCPNKDSIKRKVSEKIQSDDLIICKYVSVRPTA